MAECNPAASSSTPTSSCDRIIAEFQSQGRPAPAGTVGAEILGGYSIMTPKVGDGFVEWAVNGYDLEGKHKNPPAGVNYDKHGDWMFDKGSVVIEHGPSEKEVYDEAYARRTGK
jgi:hypothetical protein